MGRQLPLIQSQSEHLKRTLSTMTVSRRVVKDEGDFCKPWSLKAKSTIEYILKKKKKRLKKLFSGIIKT